MAHPEQEEFCRSVKKRFPSFFAEKFVLDVGSLDINGNNQYLFDDCLYLGIDLAAGRNVDIVSKGHELTLPDNTFDLVVSTECFEHDQYYDKTLKNILRLLKPGGLFLFTCATKGRAEHGTLRTSAVDAPFLADYGDWGNYYKNLEESDIRAVLEVDRAFSSHQFRTNDASHDLYFWGIKAGTLQVRMDYSFQLKFASLRSELKERVVFIQSLQNTLDAREQLLGQTMAAVKEREILIDQLVRDKLESTKDLGDVKSTLAARTRELEQLKQRLDAVLDSTSWKITAPLRAIMRVLKGR